MKNCDETLPVIARYARSGRVVVFDTETTGLGSEDEICQLSAVEYVNGALARRLNLYLNPSCAMSAEAEDVHGISLEFLRKRGIRPVEALSEFFDFVGGDALVVAHNARFDLRMLRQTCQRHEVEFALEGVETCDTFWMARKLCPDAGCYSLAHLIDFFGVKGVNNHDALDDALACGGLFYRLVDEGMRERRVCRVA